MEYKFIINGHEVKATYSNEFVDELLSLIEKWKNINSNERIIIFLAAAPGAGKSTIAHLIEYLSNGEIQALGMDGFHHYQSYILSHTVNINGIEVPMKNVKGCPESFDYDRLLSFIKKVKYENIWWPFYNRVKHDVEDNHIYVNKKIVVIEGNYLLLNEKPWNELIHYCDESIYIETDKGFVKNRLITRKIKGGYSLEEATNFYENSDGRNVDRIIENRLNSDYIINFNGIEYKKVET